MAETVENVLVHQDFVSSDEVRLALRLRVGGHPLGRGKLGTADNHDAHRKCC